MQKTFKLIILLFTLLNMSLLAEEQTVAKKISAFTAKYDLLKKSDSVGEALRRLEYLDDGSIKYSYKTKASLFIFTDTREETSLVQIKENTVIPSHYLFQRKGTGRDKKYEWTYDLDKNTAVDLKKAKQINIEFPQRIQDKLSYQLQLQLDLIKDPTKKEYSFPVISTGGSIKDYSFTNEGEEELVLPYGTIKTIKLKREVVDKEKITYAWFAPELNYLMVKLYQIKDGKPQFTADLKIVEQDEVSTEQASQATH
ncbi:MAG: hypothetical protein COA74_01335 [Gammaproteobacteria bacterium]|nr:MAG: hypothetical protein COA74_01335 [Gammaproteobacteria bacterium]